MFHPSIAFQLPPRFNADGSVKFIMPMYVPAIMFFAMGCVAPIAAAAQAWPLTQGKLTSYTAIFVAIVFLFFAMLALMTLRRWRSVSINHDGIVILNLPSIIGRRITQHQAGEIWVDIVTRVRKRDRTGKLLNWRSFTADALRQTTKALVIHDGKRAFILSNDRPEEYETLIQLLREDYSLNSTGAQWTTSFRGLIE
jgi:membrane protein implicated in regulation of membrane protease activity